MNWVDLSLIALILLSTVISFFYGFVKELFSFLSWFISFIIAFIFLDELAGLLTTFIPYADLRLGLALTSLFFISFILLEWIGYLILNSIGKTQLSIPDRFLGMVFGMARGSIIITLIILLAGLTHLPTKAIWQQSVVIHYFQPIVLELRSYWPLDIATQFNFEPPSKWKSFF
ncbi:MAG: CvpA family protein [Gammaproteobacteria bacterium]|nr:MAG: CvpA family protein [Gammaproteobacteria bacterium]RKZ41184.1 MAG: CvpA family protein [Gammaproteobacteria bacterium]RKZ73562.1 MAG: CvpA family protein [Gammaproteobacteria bacterium]